MEELSNKNTGDQLTAAEWDDRATEIENVVTSVGIALSAANPNQMREGITDIARNAIFGVDTGIANSYVVNSTSVNTKSTILRDGMQVAFLSANNNTGASTINLDSLGTVDVKAAYGSLVDVEAGDISGFTTLIYDGTNFALISFPNSIYANDTFVNFFNQVGDSSIGVIGVDTNDDILIGQNDRETKARGTEFIFERDVGADISFQSIDQDATGEAGSLSSLRILDANGDPVDAGFNVLPAVALAASDTLIREKAGHMYVYTGGGGHTLTIDDNANVPIGNVWMVMNDSGFTLAIDAGVGGTLKLMIVGGVLTKDAILDIGGVCTIWKDSTGQFKLWGGGIS